jgi:hypothetical protein
MIKILVVAGIAFLVVADVVWQVVQYRRGWRGGYFSRGMTRYQPRYNIKTGKTKRNK